jgi:uncharacterized phiE125 gp8 family phage protein
VGATALAVKPMTNAWDDGVVSRIDLVTAPTEEPIDVEFVRDQHLRVTNGSAEDAFIARAIRTARRMGEAYTQRSWMPQRRALVMDRFPVCEIHLGWPPVIEVESITYLDADGAPQTLEGSPFPYETSLPTGPKAGRGRVSPSYGMVWPTTRLQMAAVTVTYRAGYVDGGSPETADVPDDLVQGMLLVIGEMYKQRSESVMGSGITVNPAIQRARDLWVPYRVF